MSSTNVNFKVRQGLSVGDTMTVDAATGDIVTAGTLTAKTSLTLNGATSGSVSLSSPAVAGSQAYTLPSALPAVTGYVLSGTTGGVLSWVPNPDTNTTYTYTAGSTSGGANLTLTGSDSTTNTVKVTSGTGVTVSDTSSSEINIAIGQDVSPGATVTFGTINAPSSAHLSKQLSLSGTASILSASYYNFGVDTSSQISIDSAGKTTINTSNNITPTSYNWVFNLDGTTQFPNYKFPAADGSANQILTTDGSGILSWTSNPTFNTITLANGAVIKDTSSEAIAFGQGAGTTSQADGAVAIGYNAGNNNQSYQAVAIGAYAGNSNQISGSVAIGYYAGETSQTGGVAIGNQAGQTNQSTQAVAIGTFAGETNQGQYSIAIGQQAGNTSQGNQSVAIGNGAGSTSQGVAAVAVGVAAGSTSQGPNSTAIGYWAGQNSQGSTATAVGYQAGNTSQGIQSVAVGQSSGRTSQGNYAVAVGANAGATSQGAYSVAVGNTAGATNQAANTIILNATGSSVNGVASQTNSFYVAPVRNATGADGIIQYNATTKEVTYSNTITGDISSTGNVIATKGMYAKGIMDATYTDGIVMDYATGNGRISVGAADGLTIYNGGVANTAMLSIDQYGITTAKLVDNTRLHGSITATFNDSYTPPNDNMNNSGANGFDIVSSAGGLYGYGSQVTLRNFASDSGTNPTLSMMRALGASNSTSYVTTGSAVTTSSFTFTGSFAAGVLTVTATSGTLKAGQQLTNTSGVAPIPSSVITVYITGQLTGTPGGTGTYSTQTFNSLVLQTESGSITASATTTINFTNPQPSAIPYIIGQSVTISGVSGNKTISYITNSSVTIPATFSGYSAGATITAVGAGGLATTNNTNLGSINYGSYATTNFTNQAAMAAGGGGGNWPLQVQGRSSGTHANAAVVTTITGASWTGGIATVTYTTQNTAPYSQGIITIAGVVSSGSGSYNGTFTVISATTSSLTFLTAVDPGTYTSGGTISQNQVTNGAATYRIRGYNSNAPVTNNNVFNFMELNPAGPTAFKSASYTFADNVISGAIATSKTYLTMDTAKAAFTVPVAFPTFTTVAANGTLAVTGSTAWSNGIAFLTFTSSGAFPVPVGSSIVIAGVTPSAYNGTYTVTNVGNTFVGFAKATDPGAWTSGGTIKFNGGAVGQQICISNSTGNGGRMAYYDTTNSRWNYVSDDTAV